MVKWFGKIIEKIFIVSGAFFFAQTPMFMQYYVQQLTGHLSELHWQIDAMRRVAAQSGKGLESYIEKFTSSSDPDFVLQGRLMQGMVDRWHGYSEALQALQNSDVWMRPLVFLKRLDWSVARETYDSYEIALIFNSEGVLFAAFGMLFGYAMFIIFKQIALLIIFFIKFLTRKSPAIATK
jgi:Protein of unknown function (DUF2937)